MQINYLPSFDHSREFVSTNYRCIVRECGTDDGSPVMSKHESTRVYRWKYDTA